MILAARFEKLFKVIRRLSCLAFKIMLGSGNELLIRVIDVLIIITSITTSSDCDLLGPPHRPPLVASGANLSTLVGCFGWRSLSTAGGSLLAALHEDGSNRFLTIGMLAGDVEELLRGLWLVTAEFVY
jgi:hypothetical protein